VKRWCFRLASVRLCETAALLEGGERRGVVPDGRRPVLAAGSAKRGAYTYVHVFVFVCIYIYVIYYIYIYIYSNYIYVYVYTYVRYILFY